MSNTNQENTRKKYPVPSEIMDIISEAIAYNDLKEKYAEKPFGFRKAVKCGKMFQKMKRKFWNKARKLYPEIEGEIMRVDIDGEYVYVKEED